MELGLSYRNGTGRIYDYIIKNRGSSKTSMINGTKLDPEIIETIIESGLKDGSLKIRDGKYYLENEFYRIWRSYSKEMYNKTINYLSKTLGKSFANSKFSDKFYGCGYLNKEDCIHQLLNDVQNDFRSFENLLGDILRFHSSSLDSHQGLLNDVNDSIAKIGISFNLQKLKILPFQVSMLPKTTIIHENNLIEISSPQHLPDPFYNKLIQEINNCYSIQAYTAVRILLRKLFENLMLDVIRKKYHKEESKRSLFWDDEFNKSYGFAK